MTTIRKKKAKQILLQNKFLFFSWVVVVGVGGYKLGLLVMASQAVQDTGNIHPKCNLTFPKVLVRI